MKLKKEEQNDLIEDKKENIFEEQNNKGSDKIIFEKYLADFSKNHKLDNAIKLWYFKKQPKTVKKSKSEWDKIIEEFLKGKV
jgi:hypothetical protein